MNFTREIEDAPGISDDDHSSSDEESVDTNEEATTPQGRNSIPSLGGRVTITGGRQYSRVFTASRGGEGNGGRVALSERLSREQTEDEEEFRGAVFSSQHRSEVPSRAVTRNLVAGELERTRRQNASTTDADSFAVGGDVIKRKGRGFFTLGDSDYRPGQRHEQEEEVSPQFQRGGANSRFERPGSQVDYRSDYRSNDRCNNRSDDRYNNRRENWNNDNGGGSVSGSDNGRWQRDRSSGYNSYSSGYGNARGRGGGFGGGGQRGGYQSRGGGGGGYSSGGGYTSSSSYQTPQRRQDEEDEKREWNYGERAPETAESSKPKYVKPYISPGETREVRALKAMVEKEKLAVVQKDAMTSKQITAVHGIHEDAIVDQMIKFREKDLLYPEQHNLFYTTVCRHCTSKEDEKKKREEDKAKLDKDLFEKKKKADDYRKEFVKHPWNTTPEELAKEKERIRIIYDILCEKGAIIRDDIWTAYMHTPKYTHDYPFNARSEMMDFIDIRPHIFRSCDGDRVCNESLEVTITVQRYAHTALHRCYTGTEGLWKSKIHDFLAAYEIMVPFVHRTLGMTNRAEHVKHRFLNCFPLFFPTITNPLDSTIYHNGPDKGKHYDVLSLWLPEVLPLPETKPGGVGIPAVVDRSRVFTDVGVIELVQAFGVKLHCSQQIKMDAKVDIWVPKELLKAGVVYEPGHLVRFSAHRMRFSQHGSFQAYYISTPFEANSWENRALDNGKVFGECTADDPPLRKVRRRRTDARVVTHDDFIRQYADFEWENFEYFKAELSKKNKALIDALQSKDAKNKAAQKRAAVAAARAIANRQKAEEGDDEEEEKGASEELPMVTVDMAHLRELEGALVKLSVHDEPLPEAKAPVKEEIRPYIPDDIIASMDREANAMAARKARLVAEATAMIGSPETVYTWLTREEQEEAFASNFEDGLDDFLDHARNRPWYYFFDDKGRVRRATDVEEAFFTLLINKIYTGRGQTGARYFLSELLQEIEETKDLKIPQTLKRGEEKMTITELIRKGVLKTVIDVTFVYVDGKPCPDPEIDTEWHTDRSSGFMMPCV